MKYELKGRDLINVGVFTVLFFVVLFIPGMIGFFGPPFMFVGWTISLILDGIVFVFLALRSPKMYVMTLLGFMVSLLFVVTGHPWIIIPIAIVLGFIADVLITQVGKAKVVEKGRTIIAYAVFSLIYIAPLLPILFNSEEYYKGIAQQMSPAYAAEMEQLFSPTVLGVWALCIVVLGLIGGWVGTKVAGKHFERAGLTG